jgi:hypothetical protein
MLAVIQSNGGHDLSSSLPKPPYDSGYRGLLFIVGSVLTLLLENTSPDGYRRLFPSTRYRLNFRSASTDWPVLGLGKALRRSQPKGQCNPPFCSDAF